MERRIKDAIQNDWMENAIEFQVLNIYKINGFYVFIGIDVIN